MKFYQLLIGIITLTSVCTADIDIRLKAGGHDRENCPVIFRLPESLKNENFVLIRKADDKVMPIQMFGTKANPSIVWMIEKRLPAGESRRYTLAIDGGKWPMDTNVNCHDDGRHVTLTVDGVGRALVYNHATVDAPEGIDSVYRRSGYIHPICTPTGKIVTGDFEPDHPHQHGLFNAFVNTTFQGKFTDFWNQAKNSGDFEHTRLRRRMLSGTVYGQFNVTLTHVAIRDGKRVPAITEDVTVRLYYSKPFIFDVVSRQSLAGEDPVTIHENRYGGFGIRGPSEWLTKKSNLDDGKDTKPVSDDSDPPAVGDFLTSSGRTRVDGNHTRARWVEMHGPIGSEHAGVIVLAAESNFRAPQTVRLHPNKPYFCFAPMVLGEFKLEKGDVYTSRFRYIVHDGEPGAKLAERMWQDYAHPPKVEVVEGD